MGLNTYEVFDHNFLESSPAVCAVQREFKTEQAQMKSKMQAERHTKGHGVTLRQ